MQHSAVLVLRKHRLHLRIGLQTDSASDRRQDFTINGDDMRPSLTWSSV